MDVVFLINPGSSLFQLYFLTDLPNDVFKASKRFLRFSPDFGLFSVEFSIIDSTHHFSPLNFNLSAGWPASLFFFPHGMLQRPSPESCVASRRSDPDKASSRGRSFLIPGKLLFPDRALGLRAGLQ